MAKPGKGRPHRSKPYEMKIAQRAAVKRAMRTGGGETGAEGGGTRGGARNPAESSQERESSGRTGGQPAGEPKVQMRSPEFQQEAMHNDQEGVADPNLVRESEQR